MLEEPVATSEETTHSTDAAMGLLGLALVSGLSIGSAVVVLYAVQWLVGF